MLFRKPIGNLAIEVVLTGLAAEREAVRALAAVLSDAERHRASRFAFDRDRRRFIVARARLRQLLAERLGAKPESVEFTYGAHGKPALLRRSGMLDLRFNVSHCAEVAVYAFAAGREVGVDVEAVHALEDADAIAARFFSAREYAEYRALDASDRPLAFFNCWTRKEAFVKATGDGLAHPLDGFDVSLAPGEPARLLRFEQPAEEGSDWCMESFSPAPGLVAAVVVAA
jgi:4'-phosphopantetheinyl transferase